MQLEKTVVFLGQSYPVSDAKKILNAQYREPARRGDINKAVSDGMQYIILIDGYMVHEYPPSPTEIYEALSDGVIVIGSASLGALRGVELRKFGMKGIGWVFERYLDEYIDCDDEVVTLFDQCTKRPLTIPLVRIRYAVMQLEKMGILTYDMGDQLITLLRACYFEDRTKSLICSLAKKCGISASIVETILSANFDIKALDTISCLDYVSQNFRYEYDHK